MTFMGMERGMRAHSVRRDGNGRVHGRHGDGVWS